MGANATPPPAPNPETADKEVPWKRNPDDPVPQSEMRGFLMDGSIPDPGAKGVILMPAWGQILSLDQMDTVLPCIADGKAATKLPPPPTASPLPLAGGSSSSGGASPSPSGSPRAAGCTPW